MKTVFALASILSLASITAACGDSMNNPGITFNPHPKMRYELTLSLPDAPGPFDTMDGSVLYMVSNASCVPEQPISGARLTPEKTLPIILNRLSDQDTAALSISTHSLTKTILVMASAIGRSIRSTST